MRLGGFIAAGVVALTLAAPAPARGAELPAATVEAREHFFGPGNVDATGSVRPDRVILSWFSVGGLAAVLDGHVVLLDSYIHKSEDRPNYVPTTTEELIALRPEAIFIGHGHFDHAARAGEIALRTGATVIGTPEHCDQADEDATLYSGEIVRLPCVEAAGRAAEPGAEVRELRPFGDRVGVSVVKHVHSATEPPDGEGHETTLGSLPLPDPNAVLLHPPGPSLIAGLNPDGDEGGSLLYQFRVGRLSIVWHDSSGPLRERAPHIPGLLRALPPTDVQLGSVLGFNDPTNGMRDPVDYLVALAPDVFHPIHHDFVAEYGASRSMEGVMRREMTRRGPLPTDVRWLYDPHDYLRPEVMSFDVRDPRWADGAEQLLPDGAPALRLSRRCVGDGRLRVALVGDVSEVRDVSFKLGRRLIRRDTRAPFALTLHRRILERTDARRLRAVAYLDRPSTTRLIRSRPLSRCGV